MIAILTDEAATREIDLGRALYDRDGVDSTPPHVPLVDPFEENTPMADLNELVKLIVSVHQPFLVELGQPERVYDHDPDTEAPQLLQLRAVQGAPESQRLSEALYRDVFPHHRPDFPANSPLQRTAMTIGRFHYAMAGMEDLPCNPENDSVLLAKLKEGERDFDSISYSDSIQNNVTSPREMALLVKRIHLGEIVSADASAAMIALMKGCQDRRMMARYVDSEIEVAQKTGSSGRIKGNTGMVYLPSGPLLISAYGLAAADDVDGGEAIARISRLAVGAASPESVVED